jgi:2-oxoacid dehydrogenases acyltransferase (catalytic domain)
MGINKRYDGNLIRGLPSFRIINPFVMRGRNESAIYFSQTIPVESARGYLKQINRHRENGERFSLFHILLAAAVRTITLRPQLNRFVSGQRIYQRNRIQVSFMVKKEMTDEGLETNAKITFSPGDTLEDIRRKTTIEVVDARDPEGNVSDAEVDFFARMPRFLVNGVVKIFRFLDYFGIAPKGMLAIDPLYTSLYVANIGSLGLDAAYHHLYEWGNASVFMVIGRMRRGLMLDEDNQPSTRLVIDLKFTLDDRISEGIYAAKSLRLFKEFVENPSLLEEPPVLNGELVDELNLLPAEEEVSRR